MLTLSSTTPTSSSSDDNVNNHLPTILAVLFGALIGVFLIGLAAFIFLRRVYDRRRSRERAFRYGQSSVNPSAASYAGTPTPTPGAGPGYNYYAAAGPESAKGSARSGTGSGLAEMMTHVFASPVARGRSDSRAGTYTQQSDVGSYAYANTFDGAPSFTSAPAAGVPPHPPPKSPGLGPVPASPTPNSARPLLSASPIAWATGKRREGRGDADSMRTDFLQV